MRYTRSGTVLKIKKSGFYFKSGYVCMGLGGQITVSGLNQFKKNTLSLVLEIRVCLKWVWCTFSYFVASA